jgi:hypothetical protein
LRRCCSDWSRSFLGLLVWRGSVTARVSALIVVSVAALVALAATTADDFH